MRPRSVDQPWPRGAHIRVTDWSGPGRRRPRQLLVLGALARGQSWRRRKRDRWSQAKSRQISGFSLVVICACDQCIKIERQTPGAQPSALTGRDSAKRLRHSLHGSTAGFLGPSRTGDFARNDEEVLFPQWRADLRAGRWCKFKLTGRNSGVAGALVSRNDAVAIWLEHVGPLGKEIVAQV